MKITFHGAAGTVTGSKYLIETNNGKKILLDCGMFQGLGKDTMPLNSNFGFEASQVDYLFLSHAHIDHSGLIPKLVKEGFSGKIFATEATVDLAQILLKDSAYIQAADARFINKKRKQQDRPFVEPLYDENDAQRALNYFVPLKYDEDYQVDEDIKVHLYDAGHILGSATTYLTIRENDKTQTVSFSGDVGRYTDQILRSPAPFPQADYIIIESTYGDSVHDKVDTDADYFRDTIINTCVINKGKLIIPAFSVGRTQEILYLLNELENEGRLPNLKYYVDSPLSTKATMVVKSHPECFNRAVRRILRYDDDVFDFKGLHYIGDKRESQSLNTSKEPCVIISASGMATAGRVKHHIANNIANPRTTILMVGYCEPSSLGARLKLHPEQVSIFGEKFDVHAEIKSIDSMSSHADYIDLCQYLACQDPKQVKKLFIVHGERKVQEHFADQLIRKGFLDVSIPKLHETFGLGY